MAGIFFAQAEDLASPLSCENRATLRHRVTCHLKTRRPPEFHGCVEKLRTFLTYKLHAIVKACVRAGATNLFVFVSLLLVCDNETHVLQAGGIGISHASKQEFQRADDLPTAVLLSFVDRTKIIF